MWLDFLTVSSFKDHGTSQPSDFTGELCLVLGYSFFTLFLININWWLNSAHAAWTWKAKSSSVAPNKWEPSWVLQVNKRTRCRRRSGRVSFNGIFIKSLTACSIYLTFRLHIICFIVQIEEATFFYNLLLIVWGHFSLLEPFYKFVCL